MEEEEAGAEAKKRGGRKRKEVGTRRGRKKRIIFYMWMRWQRYCRLFGGGGVRGRGGWRL